MLKKLLLVLFIACAPNNIYCAELHNTLMHSSSVTTFQSPNQPNTIIINDSHKDKNSSYHYNNSNSSYFDSTYFSHVIISDKSDALNNNKTEDIAASLTGVPATPEKILDPFFHLVSPSASKSEKRLNNYTVNHIISVSQTEREGGRSRAISLPIPILATSLDPIKEHEQESESSPSTPFLRQHSASFSKRDPKKASHVALWEKRQRRNTNTPSLFKPGSPSKLSLSPESFNFHQAEHVVPSNSL